MEVHEYLIHNLKQKWDNEAGSQMDMIINESNLHTTYNQSFSYEKDSVDELIKFIEFVGGHFYHADGLLNNILRKNEYDEFKKVFLIKNLKVYFDEYIKQIKANKLEFGVACHAKRYSTILSTMLNVPLKREESLYHEFGMGSSEQFFDVFDSYAFTFTGIIISTLNGKPPRNIERRIRIIKNRKLLKDHAAANNINTDGVFSLLPRA